MNRVKLLEMLRQYFNESELRDVCFMLEVDYDSLPGNNKADKARELITYLERRQALAELLAVCERLRPQLSWYEPEMAQIEIPATDTQGNNLDTNQAHKRAQQEQVLAELLAPMVMQLERTERAFQRWNAKNLYLEAEIIRKGNLAIRDLLVNKAHLIPSDLVAEANALVVHYDRWLEEYERVRGGQEPDLEAPFVFVGTQGYPFPRQAAQRFIERFEVLRHELYEAP